MNPDGHITNRLLATDIYTVLAELQTTLTELNLLAATGQTAAVATVSKSLLRLFNGLIYIQRLERDSHGQSDYQPVSLTTATTKIVDELRPMASLYGIDLDLGGRVGVSAAVVRPAFDYATYSLIHGLISSLQNQDRARVSVNVVNRNSPGIEFLSPVIDRNWSVLRPPRPAIRSRQNPAVSGQTSGLLVANLIYGRFGNKIRFIQKPRLGGFRVNFRPTRQLNLIESR